MQNAARLNINIFPGRHLLFCCNSVRLMYRHKKRSTAVLQPLLTLKSNTMKNTVQRYGLFRNLQVFGVKKVFFITLFN